jgi:pimeloyl-ACP methyl ester carboxylesterase
MQITTDDGVTLEVLEAGAGPALLLVHGFGGAKEDFTDHVDALAARHHVITFDHRGHGESDAPDDPAAYSLDRLAADVLAVADALDVERFQLLGHSMGGMVARRVVLADAARVEALVLMDTSPGPVPGIDRDVVEMAAIIGLEQGKDTLKPLLDEAATLDTPAYLRLLAERPGYREFEDYKWASLSVVMWATLVREIASQPDELALLASLSCRTLVIVGEQDGPFLEPSRQMAATIPDAELVIVPDAGHSPQFENPQAWFMALDEFLRTPTERAAAGRVSR